jgi:hypothetical protein
MWRDGRGVEDPHHGSRRHCLPASADIGVPGLKSRKLIAVVLAAAFLSEQSARAAEIEGVGFAESMSVGASELRLHGTGLLRYRVFFKGYVAALYLGEAFGEEATPRAVLADVPRRLEIEYFWAIPADKFAEATVEGIARGTDPETFDRLRSRIDRINQLYEDVEPGDRYALTYVPGVGTELALNDRRLGVLEGADFSAALFAIWVGDEPLDESLRRQLLARDES